MLVGTFSLFSLALVEFRLDLSHESWRLSPLWTSGTRLRSHSPPLDLSLPGYLPTTYGSHLHPSPHASPPSPPSRYVKAPPRHHPTAMHKTHHDTIAVVTPPKHGVQVAAGPHRR
ncbi:hypothetical protein EDB83DRAFT_2406915 [Lactarius deliciosus]|nr:hypothetical protein EDB83DRAFT_2406915 [Lactarius deliciosus]